MKKLHLFVIKSYLGPFILTFFIALFVLLMQFLWKYVDDMIGKGLEWHIIAELMIYTSVTLVPLALPLAILISSIMTLGNLGEHFELVALKSAGLSLLKIMSPLIFISLFISITAFYFSNYLLPAANLKMGALLWDVRQQKPALNIKQGIFYNGIENYSIKVEKKNKDGKGLEGIMIYDHTDRKGNNKIIIAKSGKMKMSENERYLILSLYEGNSYYEVNAYQTKGENTRSLRRMKFKEQTIRFDLSSFFMTRTNEDLFKDHHQMLNLKQLQMAEDTIKFDMAKRIIYNINNLTGNYSFNKYISETQDLSSPNLYQDENNTKNFILKAEFAKNDKIKIIKIAINQARNTKMFASIFEKDINHRKTQLIKHQNEWHRKFTLSFACLLLFFIGAPLGAIIRKGGLGMPIVVSVLLFVILHVLTITGEKFTKEAILLPYQGMWMASAILFPFGIFLTYKATTDSVIFDVYFYTNFLKRMFIQKKSS